MPVRAAGEIKKDRKEQMTIGPAIAIRNSATELGGSVPIARRRRNKQVISARAPESQRDDGMTKVHEAAH